MLKVLGFRFSNELYGIDIAHVKEINRNVEFTPVPRSPKTVVGIFNMRGQIVTLLDLAGILGSKRTGIERSSTCIILKSPHHHASQVGFLIDRTEGVLEIDPQTLEPPPSHMESLDGGYIQNIVKLSSELMMLVDIQAVQTEQRSEIT